MKILFLFIGIYFSVSVFAQYKITGKIIDEKGSPLSLVNVSLHSARDSSYINGTTTDGDGEFRILNNTFKLGILKFSCIGYKTKRIPTLTGNLGNITLISDTTALDEVRVTADPVFFKEDKLIYIPTREQLERSPTGMILLERLGMPGINMDIMSSSVSVSGGGKVVILMNGRPVDLKELQGIPAQNILRVEYSDLPSARFPDAAVTLDFIVKRMDNGGSVSLDLTNGLSTIYGEDMIYLKLYKRRAEYSFYYNPQFRGFDSQYRTYDETFVLGKDTITRTELGLKDKLHYLLNNLYVGYNNQKGDRIFDVALSGAVNHTPKNNYSSLMLNSCYQDTLDMWDRTANKNYSPRLSFYYQRRLGSDQWFYFNGSGGYNQGKYRRKYGEYLDRDATTVFETQSRERQQYYSGSVLYKKSFIVPEKKWRSFFCVGLTHHYSYTRSSSWMDGQEKNSTSMEMNQSTLNCMLYFIKKNLLLAGVMGIDRFSYEVGGRKMIQYGFIPVLGMEYQMNKFWKLGWEGEVRNTLPTLSQLNDLDLFVDDYQIQRGKSDLKQSLSYKNSLYLKYLYRKFQFSSRWKHHFIDRPIMEHTYSEGGKIVRGVDNHKGFHLLNAELEGAVNKFAGHFSIRCYGGVRRYISEGNDYIHTLNDFYYGGRLNIFYGRWELNCSFIDRVNDSFYGETMIRQERGNKIVLSYVKKDILLSLGILNPFSGSYGEARVNSSNLAPYSNYRYVDQVNNMFFIKLVKVFVWGKTREVPKKELQDYQLESSIRKIDK